MASIKERVIEYLKEHPEARPKEQNRSLANAFKTTTKNIWEIKKHCVTNGIYEEVKEETSEVEVQLTTKEEIQARRESGRIKGLEKKNKRLLTELEELNEIYEQALQLQQATEVQVPKLTFDKRINSSAIPIIQYSDWHVEERIESRITHGMNEFNPQIAEKRVKKLGENTLKLIKKERQDTKIGQVMICLGGDFINNYLHEHDVQMNFMSPIEATVFAKGLIKELLLTLAKYGNLKKITVMCIRGNHPRLTKKMQSSNDYKMNLEALIYYMLRQELSDPIFEWFIPESELGYVEVGGKVIRCFHGHQVNYQGGIGDITVPVNKAIMKWDKTQKADWNLMHHFHSYWMPTRNCSLNGSLCGWNSYAVSKGFQYEPPLQVFHLLDSKRGFTMRAPIYCE